MPLFALLTLGPLVPVALGALLGGAWPWVAFAWITVLTATLDEAGRRADPGEGREFPGSDLLLAAVAVGMLGTLALAVRALAGDGLGPWGKLGLFLAVSWWCGQVANAASHELVHRPSRPLRRLGAAAYAALLFGHHASAHPLVHHVHVATRRDPSTARLGEGFWRFMGRAWRGSFRKGLAAESERLARAGRPRWRHPYGGYVALSLLAVGVAFGLGGLAGVAWHFGIAWVASVQLLLSDYVQHYGLERARRADGRAEPFGARHAWNSPHRASGALLLNAPRHSDHHARPAVPYPALRLPPEAEAPRLPASLPAMATLALCPPLWRRVMDGRARAWLAQG